MTMIELPVVDGTTIWVRTEAIHTVEDRFNRRVSPPEFTQSFATLANGTVIYSRLRAAQVVEAIHRAGKPPVVTEYPTTERNLGT